MLEVSGSRTAPAFVLFDDLLDKSDGFGSSFTFCLVSRNKQSSVIKLGNMYVKHQNGDYEILKEKISTLNQGI